MAFYDIYNTRRVWKWVLVAVSIFLVGNFIYFSNNLVTDLSKQERDRMQIWANATKELATMSQIGAGIARAGSRQQAPIQHVSAKSGEPKGEEGFRNRESEVLQRFCDETGRILLTGGGAVKRESNRFHLLC